MRAIALALGILLIGTGLVWTAQGLGLAFAPRSFMTSDRTWVLVGAVAVVTGASIVAWARRGPVHR
jgi:uncharacterized membrane protein